MQRNANTTGLAGQFPKDVSETTALCCEYLEDFWFLATITLPGHQIFCNVERGKAKQTRRRQSPRKFHTGSFKNHLPNRLGSGTINHRDKVVVQRLFPSEMGRPLAVALAQGPAPRLSLMYDQRTRRIRRYPILGLKIQRQSHHITRNTIPLPPTHSCTPNLQLPPKWHTMNSTNSP